MKTEKTGPFDTTRTGLYKEMWESKEVVHPVQQAKLNKLTAIEQLHGRASWLRDRMDDLVKKLEAEQLAVNLNSMGETGNLADDVNRLCGEIQMRQEFIKTLENLVNRQ